LCSYHSDKAYNLTRHTRNVHKNVEDPDVQKSPEITENVAQITKNVAEITKNVAQDTKNVAHDTEMLQNENDNKNKEKNIKCPDCYKTFARKQNLKLHQVTCKKIMNPNECYKCHEIFKNRSTASRHVSKCTFDNTQQVSTIINNTTNNINNITNNITNNVTNNNNNLIMFNIYDSDPIPFNDSHLDNKEILNEIFDKDTFLEVFQEYSYKIFEKLENRIVKKTNMRQNTSDVYDHTKKRWKQIMDNMIYYKLARGMSSSALVLTDKNKVSLDNEYKDTLQQMQIDCEVSPEKANKDDYTKYSQETKNSINILKSVVKDMSTNNENKDI
jgi:uncharacterized C2H2 Zn-finger protein